MSVVKVLKNGVWEDVAGVSGHTHTKDEIIGFPASLPANGGNADTLDGKHASEFALADDVVALDSLIGGTKVSTQIANATKIVMHRNLLDNSDFSNPINQRGKISYSSGQYCIDRWVCNSNVAGTLTVENGYIKLSNNGTGITDLYQTFENYNNMKGKRYTIVVNCNASIYFKSFTMGSAGTGYAFGDSGVSFFSVAGQHVLLRLMNANTTANFYWAALYEGEYTEETLPNYQPKGYVTELFECMRYFQVVPKVYFSVPSGCKVITGRGLVVPMRATPTIIKFVDMDGIEGQASVWGTNGIEKKKITANSVKSDHIDYIQLESNTTSVAQVGYGATLSADL